MNHITYLLRFHTPLESEVDNAIITQWKLNQ